MPADVDKFFPPDFEEKLRKQVDENMARRKLIDAQCDAMHGFNVFHLGHWLQLCETAGVPSVPAIKVAEAPKDDLLEAIDQPPSLAAAAFWGAIDDWKDRVGVGFMLRWMVCSCSEVKSRMGRGRSEWHPDVLHYFMLDDFRAGDLVYEFPGSLASAWGRPWMQLDMIGDYPVEYRAFVTKNMLDGISNYYPQRPLPDDENTARDIVTIKKHVAAMIDAQTSAIICPQASFIHGKTENWWTADFARLPSGAIVFLEGGPAHFGNGGAHCCCFPPGRIEGVALTAMWDYQ